MRISCDCELCVIKVAEFMDTLKDTPREVRDGD